MRLWEGVKQTRSRIVCDVDLILLCQGEKKSTIILLCGQQAQVAAGKGEFLKQVLAGMVGVQLGLALEGWMKTIVVENLQMC